MVHESGLDGIDDPRALFELATDAMTRHRENADEMAAIRSAAIAAMYAEGYSYKQLGEILNISTPRVGQLVSGNGQAAVEVLKAWVAIETNLFEVIRVVDGGDPAHARIVPQRRAIDILRQSGEVDPAMLVDLDTIWRTRSMFMHGAAEISESEADNLLDKAIHVNAVLTIWLRNRKAQENATVGVAGNNLRGSVVSSVQRVTEKLAKISRDEALQRKRASDATKAAASARAAANTKRQQASKTSSASSARSHLRSAEQADKRAASEESKIAAATKKLSDLARQRSAATKDLERAQKSAESKRRSDERSHAREIARQTASVHRVVSLPAPKPEKLRVLYLTANPDPRAYLRVDVEVREVQQAVKKATHRSLIEIDHRPAATPEDLLDGISENRPHIVHFSGHGSSSSLLFDHGTVDGGDGSRVSFGTLSRALAATDSPPVLLVLNACDSLDGAELLLSSVATVVAMSSSISDLAASSFAARFYSTIANAQSVQSALEMGRVAVELLDQDEEWKPQVISRDEIDEKSLVLVTAS